MSAVRSLVGIPEEANQLPPDPGLVPPVHDKGGVRQSRAKTLRRTANAITRELEQAVQRCRESGGNCQTLEKALATACQRLGNCTFLGDGP